jgi:hypothetical protein
MKKRRLACCLVHTAFLLSGCQALHVYRPVSIQVRDAETKKPIPGAEVRLSYPLAQSSLAPWEPVGTTGSDGITRLRAAPYGEIGVLLDVSLPGYMSEQKSYPVEAVQAIKPAGFFESTDQRSVNFVIDLYAEPFPGVELVLPDGYRGTVKVTVKVRDDMACPPGQRLFSYVVPPSGIVQVTGPPLLRRVYSPDFHARYANGTVLNRQPQDDEIGFWSLDSEGENENFLVGTRAEYAALRRAEQHESGGHNRSSGGKGGGGGRGRRGRNDNQSAPDGSQASSLRP